MRLRDLRTGEEREAASTDVAPGTTVVRAGEVAWVSHRGETYRLSAVPRFPPRTVRAPEDAPSLEAPMPGRILGVRTAVGATVRKGETLVLVEAMKMEHAVRAPRDGTVTRILVAEGQMVGLGDVLAEMA
ncbi:MAG: acetyl-CoA carboxylase biotin carboxyl carrier protein subunit [Thermoanaerobaculia bacterium]|nr:acetyl-CoA carboxylase biotin carboxyl carrier protein subunit [Thermoanaerobaculia bacterium]